MLWSCTKEDPITNLAVNDIEEPTATASDPVVNIENIPQDIWWNDVVFYEIFVRSFNDSDGDGIGDIQGIIDKLDYLNDGNPNTTTDLGITGIWLMPIFPSPSYHGYDVTDYRAINPEYGTLEDFKRLLNAAHSRGIKVIIDFVGNHTSEQHPWFTASAAGESKRNWYLWQETNPNYNGPWGQTVWHQRNNAYYYGLFWGGMPDLNFTTDEVTNEIKDITRFWAQDIGVDGFRIDAVKHWIEEGSNQENTESTLNWWREYYAFQKSLSPSFMTVGEAWTSTQNILPYSDSRLDYCFEFDLANDILNAIKNETSQSLKQKVNQVTSNYAFAQYGTFLTNHDQNRVFSQLGGSLPKAKLAASILLSLPGVPYLYYGEEIAMRGEKPDENIRLPMLWDSTANAGFTTGTPWISTTTNFSEFNVALMQKDSNSIWNHYRELIKRRKENPVFTAGRYKGLGSSIDPIFSFLRVDVSLDQYALIIHNLSGQEQTGFTVNSISSAIPSGVYDLINLENADKLGSLTVNANGGFSYTINSFNVNPYNSIVVRLQKP